jgi:hypothetical protein
MSDTEWVSAITRIYREALAESGPNGADRQEVLIVAGARVATEIRAGRLAYTLDSFIQSELIKVDESDGKRADAIIRTAATGQGSVELTDASLDVAVTLGGGRRKAWRDVTAADLVSMNDVRYRNYKAVRDSYQDWFKYYRAVRPVVLEFVTFGAAVAGGGFPPATAKSAAA